MIRVTVWGEMEDEARHPEILVMYPGGVHQYTADYLREEADIETRTITFQENDSFGVTDEVLNWTDVLVIYSHFLKDFVSPERMDAICRRVTEAGMGLILLHSSLWLNVAQALIGPCGYDGYREIGEKERVWTLVPDHPIAQDMPPVFQFEHAEMYQEPAGFPTPDDIIFLSWYEGGEVSRSGLTWSRGKGRVFYFAPGHATYDTMLSTHYHQVVKNAVRWASEGVWE